MPFGVAPISLMLLILLLLYVCSLLAKAPVFGQHKEAIGNLTLFFADPLRE
jgi:hypothetical protein